MIKAMSIPIIQNTIDIILSIDISINIRLMRDLRNPNFTISVSIIMVPKQGRCSPSKHSGSTNDPSFQKKEYIKDSTNYTQKAQ